MTLSWVVSFQSKGGIMDIIHGIMAFLALVLPTVVVHYLGKE